MRLEAAGNSAASCAQGLEGCSQSVTVMVDDTTRAAGRLLDCVVFVIGDAGWGTSTIQVAGYADAGLTRSEINK